MATFLQPPEAGKMMKRREKALWKRFSGRTQGLSLLFHVPAHSLVFEEPCLLATWLCPVFFSLPVSNIVSMNINQEISVN